VTKVSTITSRQKCKPYLDLDLGADDLDEISGDEQLALVWCKKHQTWEWHWCDRDDVNPRRTVH
jgi:hypothetical protein